MGPLADTAAPQMPVEGWRRRDQRTEVRSGFTIDGFNRRDNNGQRRHAAIAVEVSFDANPAVRRASGIAQCLPLRTALGYWSPYARSPP